MNRFWLTCIFLCGIFTLEAQEKLADSLAASGNFDLAAVYYEKAVYKDTLGRAGTLLLKKSRVYKEGGEYENALATVKRFRPGGDSTLNKKVIRETILLNYLAGKYQQAYNELLKYQLLFNDQTSNLVVMEALILTKLNRWEDAKSVLLNSTDRLNINDEEVVSFFPKKLKVKDPDKAYTLSLFLPGVGQMYAGYFFKGFISGIIQTGLVGFSAYSIWNGYFFTGGMTGVALFYTFYFGGARYAKQLAIKRNAQVTKQITDKIIDRLITEKAL